MVITPQHVLEQLFATGLIISSDQKNTNKDISERTLVKVREYAQFFCDLAVENYHIVAKYIPSKVALGCIYLARKCCQVKKLWGIDLEEYTGYSEDSLIDIVSDMLSCCEIKTLMDYAINNFRSGKPRSWDIQKMNEVQNAKKDS